MAYIPVIFEPSGGYGLAEKLVWLIITYFDASYESIGL